MPNLTDWDPAKYINSKEDVILYLEEALAENDTSFLLSAIGDIARSKGMTQIARELNVAREALYRSLSADGNPSFDTVIKVLDILGFQIQLKEKVTA